MKSRERLLTILSFFFCCFVINGPCFAENNLTEQTYSKEYMPTVKEVRRDTIELSDGTVWKRVDEEKEFTEVWRLHDQLIIRWDHAKKKYLLQDIIDGRRRSLVDLIRPSHIRIVAIDKDTLTLSNGSTFAYTHFIKTLHHGEHILMSLNENEKRAHYPYFIVGYSHEFGKWVEAGEVQAHLLH